VRRTEHERIDDHPWFCLTITCLALFACGCVGVKSEPFTPPAHFSAAMPDAVDLPASSGAGQQYLHAGFGGGLSDATLQLVSLAGEQRDVPLDQRVMVYSACYDIVVEEIDEAIDAMRGIAKDFGGYLQKIEGDEITIRVAADRFEGALARVESLGQVQDRELEASDVTDEYVDLQIRLKNALAMRTRLEALLAKAEDVKAALAVEKELGRITEEIELLEAKLTMLKNRVAFSAITASFERAARQPALPRQLMHLPFDWLRELDLNRLLRND